MLHTYSFFFNDDSGFLDEQCFISKNLYNQAKYLLDEQYKLDGTFISCYEMFKIMMKTSNLENNINYYLILKSQVAQEIIRNLYANYLSYFKALKEYQKTPSKFKGQPKPPKFKKYNERSLLIFNYQACQIKDNHLKISKNFPKISIPNYKGFDFKDFKQVRILPTKIKNKFKIEIVYEVKDEINLSLNKEEFSSIDFGINNLVTLLLPNDKSLLFDGRKIKSYNQFYNKNKARLCSIKDKQKHKGYTKQLKQIEHNRENYINDNFHKITRYIVNSLLDKQIGNLIVGYNEGWKDSINMGAINNQKFTSIPYLKLINQLKYKCEKVGIKLILTEESYTSKTDHLAFEKMSHHDQYLGQRLKRGLFQSSTGTLLNADVNGAIGIMRKYVCDDSYISGIVSRGFLGNPIRIDMSKINAVKLESK